MHPVYQVPISRTTCSFNQSCCGGGFVLCHSHWAAPRPPPPCHLPWTGGILQTGTAKAYLCLTFWSDRCGSNTIAGQCTPDTLGRLPQRLPRASLATGLWISLQQTHKNQNMPSQIPAPGLLDVSAYNAHFGRALAYRHRHLPWCLFAAFDVPLRPSNA